MAVESYEPERWVAEQKNSARETYEDEHIRLRCKEMEKSEQMNELPLKLHKPGNEWLVELRGMVDGAEAICGLFHSTDENAAKAFYDNAHRILSCWYVDLVWKAEGKA